MANFDLSKVSQSVINFIDQLKNEDGDSTNKLSKKEVDKISEYLAGNADTLTNEDKIYIEKEISKSLDQEVYKEITSKDPKLFNDEECKLEIESDLPKKERIKKNPDGSFDMDISGAHGSYKEIIKAFYPELLDNMQLIDAIHLFKDACGIDRKIGYIPNKITVPAELGGIKLDEKSAELYFKLIDNMDKHVGADNKINHHRDSMVRGKDHSINFNVRADQKVAITVKAGMDEKIVNEMIDQLGTAAESITKDADGTVTILVHQVADLKLIQGTMQKKY